jgi:hypothetical protein
MEQVLLERPGPVDAREGEHRPPAKDPGGEQDAQE